MNEELKEVHTQATQESAQEENAHGLDLSISSKKLADDNTREVILTALKINDINHDTLNISRSKFNKLNKEQLIEALKGKINTPKSEEKKSDTKEEFDYISSLLSLKSTAEKAIKSGDYSSLDGEVATNILNAMNNDENVSNLAISEGKISKAIMIIGAIYFISRLVGFENISLKLHEIKNKILKKQNKETKTDEEK